jgi:hypothetical protein
MVVTKISHEFFNNGQGNLETKSFLKHDLVHFAVDKVLGLYNPTDPTTHTPEIEQVAGIMHAVYDSAIPNPRFLEGAQNMFEAQGKEIPAYFNDAFIDAVRKEANGLLRKYESLRTGESMELL